MAQRERDRQAGRQTNKKQNIDKKQRNKNKTTTNKNRTQNKHKQNISAQGREQKQNSIYTGSALWQRAKRNINCPLDKGDK